MLVTSFTREQPAESREWLGGELIWLHPVSGGSVDLACEVVAKYVGGATMSFYAPRKRMI